jgi:hypothetical protein
MAESLFEKRKEKENLGWIYVHSNSDWKRRYAVILDGNLQIFSSDKKRSITSKDQGLDQSEPPGGSLEGEARSE